jgi:hypothetical protein
MQTFTAKRGDAMTWPQGPRGDSRAAAIRAPGRIVMLVRKGSVWVRLQDGTRQNFTAPSMVTWEQGDWVEYGLRSGEGGQTESYWADDFSEEEHQALLAELFGP